MAINLRRAFATDPALEQDGVWLELGEGARIRVARFNNHRHRALRERLLRPHRALLLAGRDLDPETDKQIAVACLARTILLDWQGVVDDDGLPVPFSVESAEALLTELADFRELVAGHAMRVENFRNAETATLAKN
jgi:hypothetical protein